jgi:hypothetical protein
MKKRLLGAGLIVLLGAVGSLDAQWAKAYGGKRVEDLTIRFTWPIL